jgi:hypothetical protein
VTDTAAPQECSSVAFFGQHRLRFDERVSVLRLQDVVNNLVVFMSITRAAGCDFHLCQRRIKKRGFGQRRESTVNSS